MKNLYLLVLLSIMCTGIFAQGTSSALPKKTLYPFLPSMMHHYQGGSRAAQTISVDYANLNGLRNPGTIFYSLWPLNRNFTMTVPPVTPADTAENFSIRWASVKFDSIVDTDNDVAYNKATFTSMVVDSITFTIQHENISGLNDTLFFTMYEAAATPTGLNFQAGTGNNLNYTPTNNVLWRDTIVVNTSISAGTIGTFILPVRTSTGGAVNVPLGKGFVIKLDYAAPKQDLLEIADFNPYPCGTTGYPGTSVIPGNTARWLNLWLGSAQDYRGISPLTLNNQPTNCNNYFFQNMGIGAIVTFDTGVASCPGPATGTAEFRPAYNSFPCINQSTPFSAQLEFEIPTSAVGATVTSVKIDSIRNLPCGITYTLDRANATYPGGSTGCITFTGTTTSPIGGYKMLTYGTAVTSFGTFPSSEISSLGISGFEFYHRVIANGASTCPSVASGSTGLTANCNATPLAVNPTATNNTICRGASTTLSANATGGTAPYTYSWSPTTGLSSSTVANPIASPTVTTNYTVIVTATGGATATGSRTITVNTPPSATITGATTFCTGGSTTLSAPAGLNYSWSNSSTDQSISVNTSGTYSVTTTQNGCTATSSVSVTSTSTPPNTITPSGPTTFCSGGSVTLGAPAGYTYTWSNGPTTQNNTVTTSGTYSVTISAGASCSSTGSIAVAVNPAPSATITPSGPITFCQGGSVTLSAPAGLTYLWSNNATTQTINATTSGTYSVTTTLNGCTATSSVNVTVTAGPSSTITPSGPTTFCVGGGVTLTAPAGLSYSWSNATSGQSITTSSSGTYSVTVSNGSCSATNSVTVSVVNSPSASITPSGPTTFCSGGNVILSAPAGYNYTWSANTGSASTQTVTVSTAGTYSVTVSAGASCTATASTSVTVNNPPTVTISASGPTTLCTGGTVTLTASSGQSYLWSNGQTTSSIVATQDGAYDVTVTSSNGCTGTASQTVTITGTPSATITPAGSTSLCPGDDVVLSAPSGFTYQWSNGGTGQTITALLAGTYSVTVSSGACSATSSVTVTALAAPDATVTPAGPVTACAGNTVTLSAPAGLLYAWSNGSTTQTISPTLAGSYTVTVTNANNCSATSTAVQVTVANPPTKPVVNFTSGVLSSTAATSYQWYLNGGIVNGATSQNYTPTQNGQYSVVITDATGCSNESDDFSVTGVSIANVSTSLGVTVYPNPSAGMFYISTGNFSGEFAITVLDMAGREVMTQSVNGQLQQYPLDMSLVGDGVYILRITNGEATNYTRLVVY